MRIALVGPEIEENLGLRYIQAAVEREGHETGIFDFREGGQVGSIGADLLRWKPDVVGLSLVFTGRAAEFIELGSWIRERGFGGHLTAGGHFATFHAAELLARFPCLDSIVHGEGEEILVDLLRHLDDLPQVEGLSFRSRSGEIVTNPPRRHPDDLDLKPLPARSEKRRSWLGLPVASILGSRGCWGRCTYCSIRAWFAQNPGKRLRQRSVESIADEMASLYHERGVRIFGFHDDNFLLASQERNRRRFLSLESFLRERAIGRIALQIKARPDGVDPETFAILRRMGLFRVFLGVESFAQAGLDTLGRGVDREVNHTALAMLDDLGIHTCYNLLVFDPETRLDDLRENIAFIRRWPTVPVNFGRVEVYSGTPLESSLRAQGRLLGDIFGYHYEIRDPAARAAFAMYRRVFLPRNFDHDGLASASMKLDYLRHLLSHFHPRLADPALARRASALVAILNGSQADLLERICDFLDTDPLPDDGEIGRQSRMLARERERFDERLAPRLEALVGEIEDRAAGRPVFHAGLVARAASAAAVAVVVGAAGCKQPAEDRDTTVTPSPVVEEEVPDVVEAEPEPEPPPAEPPPPETEQDASTDPTTGEAVEPPGAPVGKTPKKPRKPKKPKHPSKGLPPDYNEMLMYPMGLDDD